MTDKFKIDDEVIIQICGGRKIEAVIHNDPPNRNGHFWARVDAYRCRFNNGTSQYINTEFLTLKSESHDDKN